MELEEEKIKAGVTVTNKGIKKKLNRTEKALIAKGLLTLADLGLTKEQLYE